MTPAPEAVRSADAWPAVMRPLVREFGPDRVWQAGLLTVGFPPTWLDRYGEAQAVLAALRQSNLSR